MITEEMIKMVKNIHTCMVNNITDELYKYANSPMVKSIGEELLNDDLLPQNEEFLTYNEMLKYYIDFCSYVEEKTEYPSIILDEEYDKLVEKYIDLGEDQPIGTTGMNDDEDKVPHKYPELRGSLSKVHFLYDKEIPKKDSRKSVERYFRNVVRQMKDAGLSVGETNISIDLKYDGVSHILECENRFVDTILTRGDVDNNLGKDITPLFKKFFPPRESKDAIELAPLSSTLHLNNIPAILYAKDKNINFGVKVETFMPAFCYELYKKDYEIERCNRRSAVTSICNQSADNVDEDSPLRKYIQMQHFQISSEEELELDDKESWFNVGKVNDRYQYLYVENTMTVDLNDIDSICETCGEMIESLKDIADKFSIPIDGVVITILDKDIVELLGRNNDKNMFQVAFKFPAGVEKTTINDVDFQVGAISGFITPVVRLKPIKINGNTISNVTLSNRDKMERLKIRIGDEVIIKYDIVPALFKDDSCKPSDNDLVEFPTSCPVCGGNVENERCINPDCSAKTVGHILNFVYKNRINNIGYKTVVDFVEHGFLSSIGDLYRLYRHKDELCNLTGYGEQSVTLILNSISDKRKLLPHQLFGTIGIPSIGTTIMEKICRKINLIGNLDNIDDLFPIMVTINGIGDKTAFNIINGIHSKMDVIKDICSNVEFIPYEEEKHYDETYCFTNVRDELFEKYLLDHNIGVSEKFNSKVTTVVTPDEPMEKDTTKVKEAKKRGIEIITKSEAMKRTKYKE